MMFRNRTEAAMQLAVMLEEYKDTDSVILALPRGGVPVGYEISKRLNLPLDIVLSKKIGHPGNREYAIGSVSLSNVFVSDRAGDISKKYIEEETERLRKELKEKYKKYTKNHEPVSIKNKTVIIVDDGVATGNTLLATIDLVKKSEPKEIIVAVPVGPPDSISKLKGFVDKVICAQTPSGFMGVGQFYEEFEQVSDQEVIELLEKANHLVE